MLRKEIFGNSSDFLKSECESESIVLSNRFKKNINRIFREHIGAKNRIPHPEVDNFYERIRSKIIRQFVVLAKRLKK